MLAGFRHGPEHPMSSSSLRLCTSCYQSLPPSHFLPTVYMLFILILRSPLRCHLLKEAFSIFSRGPSPIHHPLDFFYCTSNHLKLLWVMFSSLNSTRTGACCSAHCFLQELNSMPCPQEEFSKHLSNKLIVIYRGGNGLSKVE